jgi:hypothetical protein
MKEWLVTHIDAVIPLACGIYVALKLAFKRENSGMDAAQKQRRAAGIGAMVLIAIGIFRLFTGSLLTTPPSPATVTTDDGMATVVFPDASVRSEAVSEASGTAVPRETRSCSLEGGQINLRLSYSQYPLGGKDLPMDLRLSNMTEELERRGLNLVERSEQPGSIQEFILDSPSEGVRTVMRIWFGPEGVYRAIAATGKGHHDDPRAQAFISSFRRTKTGSGE